MNSIILKELRENLKWAALGMLGVSIALMCALGSSWNFGITNFEVTTATIGSFSTVALAMGLLQIFQDQRRGRFAFVTHRPISRSNIFWSKAIAGLILYLFAAGLPLAIAILWAATPGMMAAPFEWHMALPSIWDLVNGSAWYFAGLLVAAREARWFGSRIMPLGVPFIGTAVGILFTLNIGEASLITAIVLLILIPPALSNFVHMAVFERQNLPARTLQAFAVTLGCGLCFGFGCAMIGEGMRMLMRDPTYYYYSGFQYMIDETGKPLKVRYERSQIASVTDLNDQPVAIPKNEIWGHQLPSIYLSLMSDRPEELSWLRRRVELSLHRPRRYAIDLYDPDGMRWFYVVQRRIFEGYDYKTRRQIGSIGADGFVADGQTATPFDPPLNINQGPHTIAYNEKAVYDLKTGARQVSRIFSAGPDDPILAAAAGNTRSQHGRLDVLGEQARGEEFIGILTAKTLRVRSIDRELLNVPRPVNQDDDRISGVQIGKLADGSLILSYKLYWPDEPKYTDRIVEMDSAGRIVRQTDLPPIIGATVRVRAWDEWFQIVAFPPVMIAGMFLAAWIIKGAFVGAQTAIWFAAVAAILSMIAALLLMIRPRFPRGAKAAWSIFCIFTGIPGILGLLSTRTWPARVPCANCRKPRVVTHPLCEHCATPFPPPQMQGIEIFE